MSFLQPSLPYTVPLLWVIQWVTAWLLLQPIVTRLCVLFELRAHGEETVFVTGTDCVHCDVWTEAEEIIAKWLKHIVEIELCELQNDVQIVGSYEILLYHLSQGGDTSFDMQSVCNTVWLL